MAGDLISCTNWKVISLYVLSNVFDGRELNGTERAEIAREFTTFACT